MFADDLLSGTGRGDFLDALKPKPAAEPPLWPSANSIKRGVAAEFPRVAEDAPALIGRAQDCFQGLKPGNGWHGWLIDQVAVTTLRLDRLGRSDRRLRDQAAIRAVSCWDEDKMMAAEVAGKRIAEVPRVVVAGLRGTPHGCDWLIRRWALLGQAAGGEKGWTPAQISLAHDLLATPTEERDGGPGRTFGGADGLQAAVPDRADLARREIEALRRRKAEVAPLDAFERAMVEADLEVEPTAELRRLGRYDASLRSWLRWLIAQVRQDPPKRNTPPGLYPELPPVDREEKPGPEAAPEAPAGPTSAAEASGDAEADRADRPEDGQGPLPRIAGRTRKDPREARDQARRRDRERRRA